MPWGPYFRSWHKCELPTASSNVRVRGQSGKHMLALSSSQFVKMLWGERRGHGTFGAVQRLRRSSPMSQQPCHFEASRSLTALEQDSTIIAVIEMSQSKWLVAAL